MASRAMLERLLVPCCTRRLYLLRGRHNLAALRTCRASRASPRRRPCPPGRPRWSAGCGGGWEWRSRRRRWFCLPAACEDRCRRPGASCRPSPCRRCSAFSTVSSMSQMAAISTFGMAPIAGDVHLALAVNADASDPHGVVGAGRQGGTSGGAGGQRTHQKVPSLHFQLLGAQGNTNRGRKGAGGCHLTRRRGAGRGDSAFERHNRIHGG